MNRQHFSTDYWEDEKGRKIRICDMDNLLLTRTLKALKAKVATNTLPLRDAINARLWVAKFDQEIKFRNLKPGNWDDEVELARQSFSHFKSKPFRPGQRRALDFIDQSDRRIVLLNAPPGSGKSLIGMAAGQVDGGVTYLCSTKMLQDQLQREFPEAEVMIGRNNFPCLRNRFLDASMCTHSSTSKCPHRKLDCPYMLQKERVRKAKLKILNYHYFINEVNYAGTFIGDGLIVCDEADMLEGILTQFVKLSISVRAVEELDLGEPEFKTASSKNGVQSWVSWAIQARSIANPHLQYLDEKLKRMVERGASKDDLMPVIRDQKIYSNFLSKIEHLIQYLDETWIWQKREKWWDFRPLWLNSEISYDFFFRFGICFILMSGTLPPPQVVAYTMGLEMNDIDYMEVDSSFPYSQRPVKLKSCYSLTNKTMDEQLPAVRKAIDEITAIHPNDKGVIHAMSYKLAQYISDIGGDRFITHDAQNREETIKYFEQSNEPLILVSPAITRGLDLPDDQCRFIVWAKCPFPNLGDDIISKRLYSSKFGQLWYRAEAVQSLIQGCGRGMRHEKDSCITYIPDEQAIKLVKENIKLFPMWFRDSLQFV